MFKASKELAHSLALAFPIRFWLPVLFSYKHSSDLTDPEQDPGSSSCTPQPQQHVGH